MEETGTFKRGLTIAALIDALESARVRFGDCQIVVRDTFEDWRFIVVETAEIKPISTVFKRLDNGDFGGIDAVELELR